MNLRDGVTWAAVVVQGAAAILWFTSTIVKVKAEEVIANYQKTHGPNEFPAQIVDEHGNDIHATLAGQSRWNFWAAIFTGLGVAIQALSNLLPISN